MLFEMKLMLGAFIVGTKALSIGGEMNNFVASATIGGILRRCHNNNTCQPAAPVRTRAPVPEEQEVCGWTPCKPSTRSAYSPYYLYYAPRFHVTFTTAELNSVSTW